MLRGEIMTNSFMEDGGDPYHWAIKIDAMMHSWYPQCWKQFLQIFFSCLQLAKPNEPGVFIGKINPNNPSRAFLGYVDKAASDKKIVRDVFNYGDSAFISGVYLEY